MSPRSTSASRAIPRRRRPSMPRSPSKARFGSRGTTRPRTASRR
jgi:hypothetical protein